MFEKEAEERAERKISNFIPQQWGVSLIRTEQTYETVEGAPHFYLRSLAKMWKEGAEYGYNKAKVEVEDSYRESLCNSELNLASVTEQLEELKKANEWHNLNENSKDLPGEDEWVEGLYIWYYKDKPQWDIFKVRWVYEIGELDEKLVCWYSSDDCWHKVDEPDYWRKINLPTRNEHDRKY